MTDKVTIFMRLCREPGAQVEIVISNHYIAGLLAAGAASGVGLDVAPNR
jgi:hypothetical protein